MDQLQDKTDNVAVIVDHQGETLEDYYDVGNRAMYQNVPDYVNRRNVKVNVLLQDKIFSTFHHSRWSKVENFHMSPLLAGWVGPA